MLTILALIAVAHAANHLKYKCAPTWSTLATGEGQTGEGEVTVWGLDGQIWVESTGVVVKKDGTMVEGEFVGHVHAKKCEDDNAGGHWLIDATQPATPVVEANELWIPKFTQVAGTPKVATKEQTMKPSAKLFETDPMSFVLHQTVDTESPKRVCCNLTKQMEAAGTTGGTAGKTTPGATTAGATTAGATTTAPVVPVTKCDGKDFTPAVLDAANKCTTEADAKCTAESITAGYLPDASDEAKKISCDCAVPFAECYAKQKCVITPAPAKPTEEEAEKAKADCEARCGKDHASCAATADTEGPTGEGPSGEPSADSAATTVLSVAAVLAAAATL